jgi:hypothetical protein
MKNDQVSDFIRGFADALGITTNAAQAYWAAFSNKKMQPHEREEIEAKGYAAGQTEGARWSKEQD